jgi:hypothetical protein
MAKPKSTKRIPSTKLDQVVMIRDESDECEVLAFENADAAYLFQACLNDSGYGSAYGGYEVDTPSMDLVRQTEGYKSWLAGERHVITEAYMNYVSGRMDADPDLDVASDLLNMGETPKAYVEMTVEDMALLFPDEGWEDTEEEDEEDELETTNSSV